MGNEYIIYFMIVLCSSSPQKILKIFCGGVGEGLERAVFCVHGTMCNIVGTGVLDCPKRMKNPH